MTASSVVMLDATVGPELSIVKGNGRAWAVVWPGMGAELRSLHRIDLGAGAHTVELSHSADAVYYVWVGSGSVDGVDGSAYGLRAGSMFHVDAGTSYAVTGGDDGMKMIGGAAPADRELYARYLNEEA